MKAKKAALVYNWTLTLMVIGILAWTLIQFSSKYNKFEPLGTKQLTIFKTYSKAESALFYIDQSAKYSAHQATYELAKKGGFVEPDCGFYFGSNLWLKKENNMIKKCYPNEEDSFKQIFNEELIKYLEIYPDALIPAYYDYKLSNSLEISGISKDSLTINIVHDKFAFKPAITSKNPNEIYLQSQSQEPELLREPIKKGIDIETIQKYHPEVLVQYEELCKRIGVKNPHGVCTSAEQKCCITSGYRHPTRNEEAKGARNSAHQYGLAIDINAITEEEQLRLVRANDKEPKLFTRVAIYPDSTHVHLDLMPLKGEYNAPYMILSKKTGKTIAIASSLAELESKAKTVGIG